MAHHDASSTQFYENGQQISASVTIQRSPAEIQQRWNEIGGLSEFIHRMRNADVPDMTEGSDAVKTSLLDEALWNAESIKSEPGRVFAWKTVGEPTIRHAGSVTLRELDFSRGTEVRVVIDYVPPSGSVLHQLDKALGRDPKKFLQLALFRIRQLLEAGEMATIRGQSSGREASES